VSPPRRRERVRQRARQRPVTPSPINRAAPPHGSVWGDDPLQVHGRPLNAAEEWSANGRAGYRGRRHRPCPSHLLAHMCEECPPVAARGEAPDGVSVPAWASPGAMRRGARRHGAPEHVTSRSSCCSVRGEHPGRRHAPHPRGRLRDASVCDETEVRPVASRQRRREPPGGVTWASS
jgi:hypothetical protein